MQNQFSLPCLRARPGPKVRLPQSKLCKCYAAPEAGASEEVYTHFSVFSPLLWESLIQTWFTTPLFKTTVWPLLVKTTDGDQVITGTRIKGNQDLRVMHLTKSQRNIYKNPKTTSLASHPNYFCSKHIYSKYIVLVHAPTPFSKKS